MSSDSGSRRLLPRFDIQQATRQDDPYLAYRRLRDTGTLARGGPGQYVVSHHADVAALLDDPRVGNQLPPAYLSAAAGDGPFGDFASRIMLHLDGAQHRRLRRLIAKHVTPHRVRELMPTLRRRVHLILDRAAAAGGLDLVTDLAEPIPISVVCDLLDIPEQDRAAVTPHALALGRGLAGASDAGPAADHAVTWLRSLLLRVLREADAGSPLRALAEQAAASGVSYHDLIDNVVFLFFAGFETTTSLLASSTVTLANHPEARATWRAGHIEPHRAVEELLRFDAPIQSRLKIILQPLRIGDRQLPAGRLLLLLIGSANRDERVFADPDQLQLNRQPNPHVTFGGGPHLCLGAQLARIEAVTVLDLLIRRFPTLELTAPPRRPRSAVMRTFVSAPADVR